MALGGARYEIDSEPAFPFLNSRANLICAGWSLTRQGRRRRLLGENGVEIGNSSAGINRHEVENARVLRERGSDPLGPEFCAGHCEVHSEA